MAVVLTKKVDVHCIVESRLHSNVKQLKQDFMEQYINKYINKWTDTPIPLTILSLCVVDPLDLGPPAEVQYIECVPFYGPRQLPNQQQHGMMHTYGRWFQGLAGVP